MSAIEDHDSSSALMVIITKFNHHLRRGLNKDIGRSVVYSVLILRTPNGVDFIPNAECIAQ